MKIIKLKESQLKEIINRVIGENEEVANGNYMFFSNIEQIKRQCELILKLDQNTVNELLNNGHDWADDHISSAKENMDQVFDFLMNETKGGDGESQEGDVNEMKNPCWKGYEMIGTKEKNGREVPNCVPKNESIEGVVYEDEHGVVESTKYDSNDILTEAEYQGRKVQLGKIMQGDIKKFKVYVKNDKGKVVKVNFGFGGKSAHGKRMVIKKNNPERRKSFRARMGCENPGPRWKPRYWACKTW
jgi:hypothetical protein